MAKTKVSLFSRALQDERPLRVLTGSNVQSHPVRYQDAQASGCCSTENLSVEVCLFVAFKIMGFLFCR